MSSILGLLALSAALTPVAEPALRSPPVKAYAILELGAQEWCPDLNFSADGRTLLTASKRGPVLWEVTSGRQRAVLHPRGFPGVVSSARFLPDGRTMLLQRGTTQYEQVQVIRTLSDGKAYVATVPRAVVKSAHQVCRLPDARPGKLLSLERVPACGIAASPSGRLLATFYPDGQLVIRNLFSGKEMHRVKLPSRLEDSGGIICGAFSADDRSFAFTVPRSTSEARTNAYLYDLPSRTLRRLGELKGDSVRALAISAGGRWLITGGWRGSIRILKLSGGRERLVRPPEGDPDTFFAFSISPDGSAVVLAEATLEGSALEVWDVRKGRLVCRLQSPSVGELIHIDQAADLSFVAAVFQRPETEHQVVLWKLPAEVRAELRITAGRPSQPVGRTAGAAARSVDPAPERLWTELASEDPAEAYRASWSLREQPGAAVALFRGHLRPAADVTVGRIKARIAHLDDESFHDREAAQRELQQMDDRAAPELRAALRGGPSLEVRRRVELLLAQVDGPVRSRELLREIRAVEVLEQVGTPEAEEVLQSLARGAPEARLTQEAKSSLERLSRRNAGQ